jgi:hypothetical protein
MFLIARQFQGRAAAGLPGPSYFFPFRCATILAPIVGLCVFWTVASADESEFCRRLSAVVAEQPDKFRKLRTERFDNRLESFETDLMLPGLETCRIDAISPGYFCMTLGLDNQAGDELAGELVQRVHSCYPHVRAEQQVDRASVVPRVTTDWVLDGGSRIRIVRRTYREHPGSVFLYVR